MSQTLHIFLANYLLQNASNLPPLIYIPIASPSAIIKKSEKNLWGHNLNRSFENNDDPEAEAIKQLLNKFHGLTGAFTFHSDENLNNQYFLYEMGEKRVNAYMERLRRQVKFQSKIKSFSGKDDLNDPDLGHKVYRGYKYSTITPGGGFLEDYIIINGIARTVITFESAHNTRPDKQINLMEAFFKNIILPLSKIDD